MVDEAIEAGTVSVDGLLHRRFDPRTATRKFPWPDETRIGARPWVLRLGEDELISASVVSSGGTTITAYFLEPFNSGPPYTELQLDRSTSAAFGGGATPQRDITITGVYGYRADTTPAGTVAEALDTTETGVDVSNSAAVGVGDLVLVESERMLVTDKSMITTGQTLQVNLTADANNETVAVTNGAAYNVDETLLLDAERMLIVDIAGNNLTVIRAWDGTTLAAHSGSTIYAPRTLTVVRGAQGTTAATHNNGTAMSRHVNPALVRELATAEAINYGQQRFAAWGRTIGSGESEREAGGRAIKDLRAQARAAHGRKARSWAV